MKTPKAITAINAIAAAAIRAFVGFPALSGSSVIGHSVKMFF
jgi:hypothetical protein